MAAEKLEADKAVVAATITGHLLRMKVSDNTIRYNFVREDGKWKIDDISRHHRRRSLVDPRPARPNP